MAFDELKNRDPDDLEDLLSKIEKSFNIFFVENELAHIKTFGEMCDYIANKIKLKTSDDCTTQQAFYKTRDAISKVLQHDKSTISVQTSLALIFPKDERKYQIRQLEEELSIKLNLLHPHHLITSVLTVILLASLTLMFIDWKLGLLMFGVTVLGFIISANLGTELRDVTVGDVARAITREQYIKIRRNPDTFNKNEIENILRDLFAHDLGLDKSKLHRNATFS